MKDIYDEEVRKAIGISHQNKIKCPLCEAILHESDDWVNEYNSYESWNSEIRCDNCGAVFELQTTVVVEREAYFTIHEILSRPNSDISKPIELRDIKDISPRTVSKGILPDWSYTVAKERDPELFMRFIEKDGILGEPWELSIELRRFYKTGADTLNTPNGKYSLRLFQNVLGRIRPELKAGDSVELTVQNGTKDRAIMITHIDQEPLERRWIIAPYIES